MKKMIAFLTASMVISGILAGCGGNNPAVSKDNGGSTELTISMHVWNNIVFQDDWKVFQEAAKHTGVSLKGSAPKTATDSMQVFNIMMASGSLPDIVDFTKTEIEKFALDGAFVPLEDLIKENAPNIQKFLDSNPDIKKRITAPDGHIYVIPQMMDSDIAKGWMIRKDWLDKLGLDIPSTVQEYHDTLKAFLDKDVNGNGQKDEIGFFNRDTGTGIRELLPLFGVRSGWHAENGKVQYGEFTTNYKSAMINIAKWYSEGIIDKEIFTRGANSRDILFGDNRGASTHDWFASTTSFNTKLKEKIPGFTLVAMAPPADINGKVWESSSREKTADSGWAISKDNKQQARTVKYFDFWFTDEGRRLANYGVEGEEYTLEGGKPVFKDEIINGKKPALTLLNEIGAQIPVGFVQDFEYEKQLMDKYAIEGVEMYRNNKYPVAAFPSLSFTSEERSVIDSKWPAISTHIKETAQNWVFGTESPEDGFDKYMSTLKSMGIEEVLAVYQSAYDRYAK